MKISLFLLLTFQTCAEASSPGKNVDLRSSQWPVLFEPNVGQAAAQIHFVGRAGTNTVLLSPHAATLLFGEVERPSRRSGPAEMPAAPAAGKVRRITMRLLGGEPGSRGAGLDTRGSHTNYVHGAAARTLEAPHFARVRFAGVYSGIDLVYHGREGRFEHDFVVQPGASPSVIRIAFEGAGRPRIDGRGDLVFSGGRLLHRKPTIYQDTPSGRKTISGGYRLLARGEVGFSVGAYDRSLPLVIDPVTIITVSFLGGPGDDSAAALAFTPAENDTPFPPDRNILNLDFFVGGRTTSTNLLGTPVTAAGPEAFIARFGGDFRQMRWLTVFGGAGDEAALDMDVDPGGDVFFTGFSTSSDFPRLNPFQSAFGGGARDAIVGRLNGQTGRPVFLSFLGGSGSETAFGLTRGGPDEFFLCGSTDSPNFPTTPGTFDTSYNGGGDAFISRINGNLLGASTFLGGAGADQCRDLDVLNPLHAIDPILLKDRYFFFTGPTQSPTFPTSANALQRTLNGPTDAWIAQVSADLTKIPYASLFGGSGGELPYDIFTTPNGTVIFGGETTSTSQFPAAPAFPVSPNGGNDAFFAVFQFNPLITPNPALLQSGLVGGSSADRVFRFTALNSPGGGGAYGLRAYGQTSSSITSTLPGLASCTGADSLFIAHIPLFTGTYRSGCLGGKGFFEDAKTLPNGDDIVLFDVDAPGIQTTPGVIGPAFRGATDGMFMRIRGFSDPARFDGAVGLDQVTFNFSDAARSPNSSTGYFWIDVPKLIPQTPRYRGYFNVFIPGVGWTVENLAFDSLEEIPLLGALIRFDTSPPPAQPITSKQVMWTITAEPQTTFNASAAATVTLPVTARIHNAQGEAPAGNAIPEPPRTNSTLTRDGQDFSHVLPWSFVNVQAAQGQAASMAYANSLAWLTLQHDHFRLPHRHAPGGGGDQTLVGQLDAAMTRSVFSRVRGEGISGASQIRGKFQYLSQNGLADKLVHKYQGSLSGVGGDIRGDYTSSGITLNNEGNLVTFEWLCDQIKNGEDVELAYRWGSEPNTNGDVVRVVGCGRTLGQNWIKTVEDGNQSSTDTGDVLGRQTTHRWIGDPDRDGVLNLDNVSTTRVVRAVSESFLPEMKASPGAAPLTFQDALTNPGGYRKNFLNPGGVGVLFGLFNPADTGISIPHRDGLADQIGNTRLIINGQPVPLFYSRPDQIAFQMPYELSPGEATMVVTQGDKRSAAFTFAVRADAPGILTLDPAIAGANRGAIQKADYTLHLPSNPVKAGEILIVYTTGLGKTNPAAVTGQPSPSAPVAVATGTVLARVGGQPATVAFAGLTPGAIGLGQVNIVVPQLAPGDHELTISVNGVASNPVLITVAQ